MKETCKVIVRMAPGTKYVRATLVRIARCALVIPHRTHLPVPRPRRRRLLPRLTLQLVLVREAARHVCLGCAARRRPLELRLDGGRPCRPHRDRREDITRVLVGKLPHRDDLVAQVLGADDAIHDADLELAQRCFRALSQTPPRRQRQPLSSPSASHAAVVRIDGSSEHVPYAAQPSTTRPAAIAGRPGRPDERCCVCSSPACALRRL